MDSFADYILAEKNCTKKMEIMCYLSNKKGVFFDNSVILKTELARLFIENRNINIDENLVITACLLYACKKDILSYDAKKIQSYAKEGAEYIETLGFSKRFCKICTEVNRYVYTENREKESDILEIVDNFGGLVLDRPERKGFPIDVAMNVLENRNLKDTGNIYLREFRKFIYLEKGNQQDNEEVYIPNSECNPDVEDLIRNAKSVKMPEDFIAYLSGAKEPIDIESRVMQKLKGIKSLVTSHI